MVRFYEQKQQTETKPPPTGRRHYAAHNGVSHIPDASEPPFVKSPTMRSQARANRESAGDYSPRSGRRTLFQGGSEEEKFLGKRAFGGAKGSSQVGNVMDGTASAPTQRRIIKGLEGGGAPSPLRQRPVKSLVGYTTSLDLGLQ